MAPAIWMVSAPACAGVKEDSQVAVRGCSIVEYLTPFSSSVRYIGIQSTTADAPMTPSSIATLFLLAVASTACATALPPASYPMLDPATKVAALVVATVGQPVYLPVPNPCPDKPEPVQPDGTQKVVICTFSPPFFFEAGVLEKVHGGPLPSPAYVVTSSHFGTHGYRDRKGVDLMLLYTDGKQVVLARNGMLPLLTDRSGRHFLPLRSKVAASFLPCAVSELREEINYANFDTAAPIPAHAIGTREQEELSTYLSPVDGGYKARYAIAVERLQAWMAQAQPELKATSCPASAKPSNS